MRAAPPTECRLAGCHRERWLIVALYAATGAVLAWWLAGLLTGRGALPAAGAASLSALPFASALLGGWLARRLLPADPGRLRWDGALWWLVADATGGYLAPPDMPVREVSLRLDLGPWLLLRLHTGADTLRWAVLEQADNGADWHALLVALAAHAGYSDAAAPRGGRQRAAPVA